MIITKATMKTNIEWSACKVLLGCGSFNQHQIFESLVKCRKKFVWIVNDTILRGVSTHTAMYSSLSLSQIHLLFCIGTIILTNSIDADNKTALLTRE